MARKKTRFPFEVGIAEVRKHLDVYVDSVFSCLESEFLVLPRGPGFVDYATFETGYETLKRATQGFRKIDPERVLAALETAPITFVVIRAMLGFTPPEWAYITTQRTGMEISQSAARTLDRKVRLAPDGMLSLGKVTGERMKALVRAACELLNEGSPAVGPDKIHRLDKADTRGGPNGLCRMSELGVPYAMVLYERFLGRPFAGHRDAISELIGDGLESAVESILHASGVTFRKTMRAERIDGFDQAPDFIIPTEFNPQVVIEAKVTEDDGTARDKVARIQRLDALRREGQRGRKPKYELIACIGGRGFGQRREDMRRLLYATGGKVFTANTLTMLVQCTRISEFVSRQAGDADGTGGDIERIGYE